MKKSLIAALVLIPLFLLAADAGTYKMKGTVGKREVVMEFEVKGATLTGTMRNKENGKEFQLQGVVGPGGKAKIKVMDGDEQVATLKGELSASGFSGGYKNNKNGNEVPCQLTGSGPAVPAPVPVPAPTPASPVAPAPAVPPAGANGTWSRVFSGKGYYTDEPKVIELAGKGYLFALVQGDPASGRNRVVLFRLDSSGNIAGRTSFPAAVGESLYNFVPVADGGFLMLTSVVENVETSTGEHTVIRRFDRESKIVWEKVFKEDRAMAACQNKDGSFTIAGLSWENGPRDTFVMRLDRNGNMLWSRVISPTQNHVAHNIVRSPDDGVVLVGFQVLEGLGWGGWIYKLDRLGHTMFDRRIEGAQSFDMVVNTPDGGLVAVGNSKSPEGNIVVFNADASGAMRWQMSYGTDGTESASMIAPGADGGYLVAAVTEVNPENQRDLYLLKIDGKGVEQWTRIYGGKDRDYCSSLIATSDGGYLVGLATKSFGVDHQGYWFLKLDRQGNLSGDAEPVLSDLDAPPGTGAPKAPDGENPLIGQALALVYSTGIGQELKPYLDYLRANKLIVPYQASPSEGGSAEGYITNVNISPDGWIFCNWKTEKIKINTNQPLEYIASTIVHEGSHFRDLAQNAEAPGWVIFGETEINAHANQYLFFKQANLLDSPVYKNLGIGRRDGMSKCYECRYEGKSKEDAQQALVRKSPEFYSLEKQKVLIKLVCTTDF